MFVFLFVEIYIRKVKMANFPVEEIVAVVEKSVISREKVIVEIFNNDLLYGESER